MSKDNLFVSYHHDDEEDHYKFLLQAWSESHSDFFRDIKFNDNSIGVSINSSDSNYIKRRILEKMNLCDHFLCIVGRYTHNSEWVDWEIGKAIELDKKIAVIKIRKSYITPVSLLGIGANFAQSFNYVAIKDALKY